MQLLKRLAAEAPRSEPSSDPALDEALAQLNARDQELLRLWAWESLTAAEIALALGISPNAASIRLHRAIKMLKKQLTERKEPPGSGQQLERQGEQSW
jgi:RNA polymerase sigma-70 factor (ECF subfamily)